MLSFRADRRDEPSSDSPALTVQHQQRSLGMYVCTVQWHRQEMAITRLTDCSQPQQNNSLLHMHQLCLAHQGSLEAKAKLVTEQVQGVFEGRTQFAAEQLMSRV